MIFKSVVGFTRCSVAVAATRHASVVAAFDFYVYHLKNYSLYVSFLSALLDLLSLADNMYMPKDSKLKSLVIRD